MKNKLQIIGNKIYYYMQPVGFLNEINYCDALLKFKSELLKINDFESMLQQAYEKGQKDALEGKNEGA